MSLQAWAKGVRAGSIVPGLRQSLVVASAFAGLVARDSEDKKHGIKSRQELSKVMCRIYVDLIVFGVVHICS